MFVDGFVNLCVADIEAGLRFYRDLLGFEETFRTPNEGTPTHVELRLNGARSSAIPTATSSRSSGRSPS
jgi:lactoylglutathione lyase